MPIKSYNGSDAADVWNICWMFYTGIDAVEQGEPFCCDSDRGTATLDDDSRFTTIERPTIANRLRYAGTSMVSRPANPDGQWIPIAQPDGKVYAKVAADTTVDATELTFSCQPNLNKWFIQAGLEGKGTIRCMKTKTSSVLTSCLDGSATYTAASKTVTLAGSGTDAGVAAGDKVLIISGQKHATNGATCTPGEYTVATSASGSFTLTASAASDNLDHLSVIVIDTTAAAQDYTCEAYSYDGAESGGTEWLAPNDNAASTQAAYGTSYILEATNTSGDATITVADGTVKGQRKQFICTGTQTTNGYKVIITTGTAYKHDGLGIAALATVEFASAGRFNIHWNGSSWWFDDGSGGITLA